MKELIKKSLSQKSMVEIRGLYEKYDTDTWSPQAFEVMHEILTAEGIRVPTIEELQTMRDAKMAGKLRSQAAQSAHDTAAVIKALAIIALLILGCAAFIAADGKAVPAVLGLLSVGIVTIIVYSLGAILSALGNVIMALNDLKRSQQP